MERKIGEIFEYNGEWYQCVESQDGSCKHCDMNFEGKCPIPIKECTESGRSDKSYVIFKKLEKVGEPFELLIDTNKKVLMQEYKIYGDMYIWENKGVLHTDCFNGIRIEIKQTKEDMEEKKLKPFDLEAAKQGKPVCTRDGRKARIICFDKKGDYPIVALVNDYNKEEYIKSYDKFGKKFIDGETTDDLMMLPGKKEGWVNLYYNKSQALYYFSAVYKNEKEALEQSLDGCIDTIKIQWEE